MCRRQPLRSPDEVVTQVHWRPGVNAKEGVGLRSIGIALNCICLARTSAVLQQLCNVCKYISCQSPLMVLPSCQTQ